MPKKKIRLIKLYYIRVVSINVVRVAGGGVGAAEAERQKDRVTRHQQLLSSSASHTHTHTHTTSYQIIHRMSATLIALHSNVPLSYNNNNNNNNNNGGVQWLQASLPAREGGLCLLYTSPSPRD